MPTSVSGTHGRRSTSVLLHPPPLASEFSASYARCRAVAGHLSAVAQRGGGRREGGPPVGHHGQHSSANVEARRIRPMDSNPTGVCGDCLCHSAQPSELDWASGMWPRDLRRERRSTVFLPPCRGSSVPEQRIQMCGFRQTSSRNVSPSHCRECHVSGETATSIWMPNRERGERCGTA